MSAPRTRWLAGVAGLLALAVLALWMVRTGPLPPERAADPVVIAPPPVPVGPSAATSLPRVERAPASEAPPPWSAPASSGPSPLAPTDASPAAEPVPARSAALAVIQRQLAELVANGQEPDTKKLDQLLAEVVRVQGSPNIGGVNVEALRHNLGVAEQMKAIATDMQQLSSQGAKADPAQLQAQMARIVELQAQMRVDVLAAPVAAPPPVVR